MKRNFKIKALLIFFAMAVLVGCLPEEKPSEFVRVVIADHVLKIPRGYFDGRAATGKDTESVVLEYSLPDFEVLPEHPRERAARQKLIKEGHMRSMLLEATANRPPFDIEVGNLMKLNNFKQEAQVYDLEKYIHIVPEPISPDPAYKPYQDDDFFIERGNDGSVISYLRCSPPKKHEFPSCRHRFDDNGILYQISWPIRELPNWHVQRDNAIQFIKSLEVNETIKD